MKFKKLTASILATMMAVSLVACGNTNEQSGAASGSSEKKEESSAAADASSAEESTEEESTGITFPLEEPMTFTMFNLMNGETSLTEVDAWHYVEDRTNVHFEQTEVTTAELSEKMSLILASGDYPEVFYKSAIDANRYGKEGILIPLEDLIREYAPTLTALLDEGDLWGEITAEDGHVYALPRLTTPSVQTGWYFNGNQKWLDNLGLEMPTTVDELYDVLTAIKEQDANGNGDPNDEIPLTFASNGLQLQCLMEYLCTNGVVWSNKWLSVDGDQVSFIPATEEFKDFLATCTKWYAEGLIDENCFVQTYEQLYAIGKSSDQYGFFFGPANEVGGSERKYDYHVVDAFEEMKGLAINAGVKVNGMAITDKCEHPEVMIAWADWFYTPEGTILAMEGVENVNWKYDEEGYRIGITPEISAYLGGTSYMPCNTDLEYTSKLASAKNPDTRHYVMGGIQAADKYGVKMPTLEFSEDASERYSDLNANIIPYVENYMAKVVTGETALEDSWAEFQSKLEAMGAAEYLELMVGAMGDGYVAAE